MRIAGGENAESVLANPDTGSMCPFFRIRETRFELLPRLGVTLLLVPPTIGRDSAWQERRGGLAIESIYEGPDGQALRITGATPGPFVVHDAQFVQSEADALLRFTDSGFDFRKTVLIENAAPFPHPDTTAADSAKPDQILSVAKKRNEWTARISTGRPGWLVIPDTWSPGWRAEVNGKAATLCRANYAFRAVPVPAGESEVRMEYHAEGFAVGAAISGGSALLLTLGSLVARRKGAAHRTGGGAGG